MSGQIVVFGGSGFIGSHLLRYLAASGHTKLVGIDLREPRVPVPFIDYKIGDVRDLATFRIDGPIDTIINLAAVHKEPGHKPHEYYETNVLGATNVTAFARQHNVNQIVFTSSISVYGPGDKTKTEQTPPAPETPYGWSKFLAETIHLAWVNEDDNRRLVICRPAVIFGSGEGGNFTRLASLLKRGVFVFPGRKDTIKAVFYVEDLVEALLAAKEQTEQVVLFNACYPDRYTIEQIVNTFRSNHFPRVRTVLLPRAVVTLSAAALRPFSRVGLGIHPERVMKLVRSTDVVPGWLLKQGYAKTGHLQAAIERWSQDSNGRFV